MVPIYYSKEKRCVQHGCGMDAVVAKTFLHVIPFADMTLFLIWSQTTKAF